VNLSVIIPVKDDARLEVCLRALAGQTLPRDRYEIVVVDNGPADFARALAERFDARYLTQRDGGAYAARDRGASEARGEVLVFTDADCRAPPGWLATIERLFADPTCQVVIGPSSSADSSTVSLWAQAIDNARWDTLRRSDRIAFCDTRNLALRAEVLAAVPFDPAFRQAGDVDLGLRLYRAGFRIRMEPDASIAHDNPRSLRVMLRRGVRRGRGVARLERKHAAFIGPIGERPLRLGGVDLKRPILRAGRLPVVRWAAISLVTVSLVPLLGVLWLLARVPFGRAAGQRLFVVFERLTLLLGRLLG
jgi:glycosyltransferase involved in cell wall biosynthesis